MSKAEPKTAAYSETIEAMTAASGDAMRKSMERTFALMNETSELTKANFEAFSTAASTASKGLEAINTRAASYMKSSMEASMAAAREITSAKSMQKAVELQAGFAKKAFDTHLEEVNAFADMYAAMVKDVMQPINTQAGQVVALMQRRA